MKRIGILTIHRIYNHGSFLQAFALKSMIEELLADGSICELIDWPLLNMGAVPKYLIPEKPLRKPFGLLFKLHTILGHKTYCNDVELAWLHYSLGKKYVSSCQKHLGVRPTPNYLTDYDMIIVGSDESFNCTQDDAAWDTTFCFHLNHNNVISYAASFGYSTEKRINEYNIKTLVQTGLKSYKSISVRDKNSADIVNDLIGQIPSIHLDPVLIYDYSKFSPSIRIKKEYILVYNYLKRINDSDFISKVRHFAKQNRLRIISVFEYCPWADINISLTPFEVLAYFKNAKYVITDTFHGAVMSIKFNKKFGIFVRNSNFNKLYYLLERFGLCDQIITSIDKFPAILSNNINWKAVNRQIKLEQTKSLDYLDSNLKRL